MISNEIYNSDVVYIGGKILAVTDFQSEFPDWYEAWNTYSNENDDEYILISDCDYGVSATLNVFYKVQFDKAEADLVCELEGGTNGGVYHPPIRLGNQMIFAPCKSKKWGYLDVRTGHWTYVDVPQKFYDKSDEIFIRSWKPIKDSLIYLSGQGIIVKLDYKSGEMTYYDCLRKLLADSESEFSISAMSTYRSSVLFASDTSDKLFELDMKSMDITEVHRIGHSIRGIKAMFAVPKTDWIFFIANTDKKDLDDLRVVYKWNILTHELLKIDHLPINPCGENGEKLLSGFLYYKGDLYVTPQQGDCFIRIDIDSNSAERIEINVGYNLLERKNTFYKRWGDNMAFPMFVYNGFANAFTVTLPYDFSIAEIDFENKKIFNRRKWRVNGIEKILKQSLIGLSDGVYYENYFYSLKDWLGGLM